MECFFVPLSDCSSLNVVPFRGCIKELRLNSKFVELSKPIATKNVLPGCYIKVVHTVSFPSEYARSVFHNVVNGGTFELMFYFKTDQQTGHLTTVQSSEKVSSFLGRSFGVYPILAFLLFETI